MRSFLVLFWVSAFLSGTAFSLPPGSWILTRSVSPATGKHTLAIYSLARPGVPAATFAVPGYYRYLPKWYQAPDGSHWLVDNESSGQLWAYGANAAHLNLTPGRATFLHTDYGPGEILIYDHADKEARSIRLPDGLPGEYPKTFMSVANDSLIGMARIAENKVAYVFGGHIIVDETDFDAATGKRVSNRAKEQRHHLGFLPSFHDQFSRSTKLLRAESISADSFGIWILGQSAEHLKDKHLIYLAWPTPAAPDLSVKFAFAVDSKHKLRLMMPTPDGLLFQKDEELVTWSHRFGLMVVQDLSRRTLLNLAGATAMEEPLSLEIPNADLTAVADGENAVAGEWKRAWSSWCATAEARPYGDASANPVYPLPASVVARVLSNVAEGPMETWLRALRDPDLNALGLQWSGSGYVATDIFGRIEEAPLLALLKTAQSRSHGVPCETSLAAGTP